MKIWLYLKWAIIILFSIVGGVLMYAINENDPIKDMWDDRHLARDLSISILSVFLFLQFTQYMARLPAKLIPFLRRTLSYYVRVLCCYLFVSGTATLLFAVILSGLILWFIHGVWIFDTTYFVVDFYFVLISIFFIQVLFFTIHFFMSVTWAEEPIHVDYLEDRDYRRLLGELDVLREERKQEAKGLPVAYLKELEGISIEDIAYIYSFEKVRFIRTRTIEQLLCPTYTLERLILMLPPEQFFMAGRHLIVSRSSIRDVNRLPNYLIELELAPPFEHKRRLSETATKEFKAWYNRDNK